jgi:ubiquinone biosynthesis protein
VQNRVGPEPADRIRNVLTAELGCDPDDVFAEFDWEPLAAGSIAQTHTARLHDGDRVVVKVQRPDIAAVMERYLAALALLARFAERRTLIGRSLGSADLLAQFALNRRAELDFRREADVMEETALLLGDDTGVRIPRVYREFCSRRVLVQERLAGPPSPTSSAPAPCPPTGNSWPRRCCARRSIRCCGPGCSTPIPIQATSSSSSTAVLGSSTSAPSGGLDALQQAAIGDVMRALVQRDIGLLRDAVERVADVAATSPGRLERALARLVADHVRPSGDISAAVIQDLIATLGQFRIRVDGELVVLARALATLDGTLRMLCPDFSLVAAATTMVAPDTNPFAVAKHLVQDEVVAALPHLRRLPELVDRISSDPPGLTPSEAVAYAGLFAGTVLLVRVVAAVIRDGTT